MEIGRKKQRDVGECRKKRAKEARQREAGVSEEKQVEAKEGGGKQGQ